MLHGSAPEGSNGFVKLVFCGVHEMKIKSNKPANDEIHFMLVRLLAGRFCYRSSGSNRFSKIRRAVGIPCKFLNPGIPGISATLT